jgi:hypothetical protein
MSHTLRAVGNRSLSSWPGFSPSWPGLTRLSAHHHRRVDGRVKPGHDDEAECVQ